ncbi:MAG: hypothetical protein IKO49_04055 [Bacilli bacterium]|nr:hypothetical protein [Bacilli bacterium]
MGKYDGKCGSCSYSEYYKSYGRDEKIYCTYYGTYYWASDSCYHYRGSFIATAICEILGEKEHKEVLQKIREIRREVLEKDKDYNIVLERYDQVAPQIAAFIEEDYEKTNNNSLAVNIFNKYIKPTVELYNNGQIFQSIEKYSEMTDLLEKEYGFNNDDYSNIQVVTNIKNKKLNK